MQQKRNHHARIERRLAEPTHIAAHDRLEIQALPHQPNDKPRDVVLGHEVPHIRRQKQRLIDIPGAKVLAHSPSLNQTRWDLNSDYSDRLLGDIIDIVFSARPSFVSFEAANPRHAHEWALFETVKLPAGKILIPGVIESKSNFIEHPELIANRISNYAKLVGRENVIAGSDCGYGTWVGQAAVDADVVWAKLAALTEGARIATNRFWKQPG